MPVVSDASPLILLAKIGKLNLLKELYLEIIIPSQVPDIVKLGEKLGLHKGETAALGVAKHLGINEILADYKLARIAARILGLRAIGCLGVIMKAYETDVIKRTEAIDSIEKIVKAGLWVSPEVLSDVFKSLE